MRKRSGKVLFRASVPAGAILSKTGTADGPFKYLNAAAKTSGGVLKLKIKKQLGVFRATVVAYGNLLASQSEMVTLVHAGKAQWAVAGSWAKRGRVWRFLQE